MTDLVAQLVGALERVDAEWSSFWPLGPDIPSSSDRACAIAPETAEIWRAIRSALSAAKDGGWLPIETAPKAGSFLAVLECGGEQTICTMRHSVAASKNSRPNGDFVRERVTHWQPLPNPPKGEV